MKQMIHCCFTSHQEVIFRCPEDVGFFLNLLALTSWKYGVDIFADTEMSIKAIAIQMNTERIKPGTGVRLFLQKTILPMDWYYQMVTLPSPVTML